VVVDDDGDGVKVVVVHSDDLKAEAAPCQER